MTIKSLEEIKSIIEQNPEAGGVGYVIAPQLIKIAHQMGLLGYDRAIQLWNQGQVFTEQVVSYDPLASYSRLLINWEGPSIVLSNDTIILGIKRTLENIEAAIAIKGK